MKRIAILLIVLMVVCVGFFSGCNESKNTLQSAEDRILGTWIFSDTFNGSTRNFSYTFLSDKTFEFAGAYKDDKISASGTWRIGGQALEMDVTEPTTTTWIKDYTFSNNDNTLTFSDSTGTVMNFTKQ